MGEVKKFLPQIEVIREKMEKTMVFAIQYGSTIWTGMLYFY